jgi:hypothetical protein
MGFPHFLKDFSNNSKTFQAADFPEAARELGLLGVTDITVNFRIQGGEPLVQLLRIASPALPKTITRSGRP